MHFNHSRRYQELQNEYLSMKNHQRKILMTETMRIYHRKKKSKKPHKRRDRRHGEGIERETFVVRMKMTNRGLPSSSILGRGGGGGRWNWRAIIPLFPLASTTISCRFFSEFLRPVGLREGRGEPRKTPFSWAITLELDSGSRARARMDMATSISHSTAR